MKLYQFLEGKAQAMSRKFFLFIGFLIIFIFIYNVFFSIPIKDSILIRKDLKWSVSGEFINNDKYPLSGSLEGDNSEKLQKKKDLTLWSSWTGDDKNIGQLVSPTFRAPAILSMFVAGYPNSLGNELFLEKVTTKERLDLKVRELGETWIDIRWFLPFNWQGTQVRLVAIDGATERTDWLIGKGAWLGVSSPRSINLFNLIADQFSFLLVLPVYIYHFLLFIIPGLLITISIIEKYKLKYYFITIMSMAVSSLLSYISFWIYFLNRYSGIVFSVGLLLLFLYLVGLHLKDTLKKSLVKKYIKSVDFVVPTSLMILVGLFYTGILFAGETSQVTAVDVLAQSRFFRRFPVDNIIPLVFAEHLYKGTDPRNLKNLIGMLSSDRPPLQAGLVLLHRPFVFLNLSLHYQIISTISQCSWIAAIWALCRTMGLSATKIFKVLAFSILSGFFLFNSIFTWPKLLAASLVVFAFALLLEKVQFLERPSQVETTIAAAALALGLLAHSGVIFTIPAVILLLLRLRCLPRSRSIVTSFFVLLTLGIPWKAYQAFFDPPGDRLTKMHIAGVTEVDGRSDIETIIDAYRRLDLMEIISNKWGNFKTLFGNFDINIHEIGSLEWRDGEFFHLFKALGILNIGWILLLLLIVFRRKWHRPEHRVLLMVIEVSVVSLLTWILVMFGPGTTIIHAGSYATMMILFVGLASLMVTNLPHWLSYILLLFHIIIFSTTWLITKPVMQSDGIMTIPNLPMIVLAIVTLVGIVRLLVQLSRQSLLT